MDPEIAETIRVIFQAILGGGGLVGIYAAAKGIKARKRGAPARERSLAIHPADWESLSRYWQKEITTIRDESIRRTVEAERKVDQLRHEKDQTVARLERHIERLESHIWQQFPPPPPPREDWHPQQGPA
jgi:hypothetical protein